jgi:serine/threonine-protein kinase RsbT
MLEAIEHHLRLYVDDPVKRRHCGSALRALVDGGVDAPIEHVALEIRSEDDIGHARIAARELAAGRGFSAGGQTRLVTAVSELTRNIVQYARSGRLELRFLPRPGGVEITATDAGPGIANLEEIFSGKYKSKLGMGQGLLGVKRLAQSFDIKTGAGKGTTVTALFKVL